METFNKGDYIFRENDPSNDNMYLIIQGCVNEEDNSVSRMEGENFGESGV
jgi:CRP-like cAMP-binding protein